MASKRSKAAKKGWATRRAKELQRRLAALKGWKTRRGGKKPAGKKKELTRSEFKVLQQLSSSLIEQVFLRRVRFFPEARRRTLKIGTRLMHLELLMQASKMTKSQMRAAAGNKAYENEDGYNPFWYHG
jgi:hypothetical protein